MTIVERTGNFKTLITKFSAHLDVEITRSSTDGSLVRLPLVRFGTFGYMVFAATETLAEASPQSLHPLVASALLGLAFFTLSMK